MGRSFSAAEAVGEAETSAVTHRSDQFFADTASAETSGAGAAVAFFLAERLGDAGFSPTGLLVVLALSCFAVVICCAGAFGFGEAADFGPVTMPSFFFLGADLPAGGVSISGVATSGFVVAGVARAGAGGSTVATLFASAAFGAAFFATGFFLAGTFAFLGVGAGEAAGA